MDPKQRQALCYQLNVEYSSLLLTVICWVIFAFYMLKFILLSLKIGYLLTRAEDVFIVLLWAQIQGIPGPQFTMTFELLVLRTQEVVSLPIGSVGDSWSRSQR